jgi:acetyl esterase/lipase
MYRLRRSDWTTTAVDPGRTSETLLDDSILFTDRARKAGVKVRLEQWDRMITLAAVRFNVGRGTAGNHRFRRICEIEREMRSTPKP